MTPDGMPLYMGKLATATVASLWRDIKVIHDHAYVVSEAPLHGTQILDLTALRLWEPGMPPQEWLPDAVLPGPSVAHNAVAFEDESLLILVGSDWFGGGAAIFDVQNPQAPQLLGGASEWGYIHDAQAVTYNGPMRSTQASLCCSRLGRQVQHFGHQRPNGCDFDWCGLLRHTTLRSPSVGSETQDHAFLEMNWMS